MKTLQNQAELLQMVRQCRPFTTQGKVANYIPQLGKADPGILGISIYPCDGDALYAGDSDHSFTLQSISKVFSLLLALEDRGAEAVFNKVGVEPAGDEFNSIRRLETTVSHKPYNPMINAGAIAVASMIRGKDVDEKFSRILTFIQTLAGNRELKMNEDVYRSESKTGDRNRSLAYFMKSTGIIENDVEETLELYFRFNAIEVTCMDLAKIGCVFAHRERMQSRWKEIVSDRHMRMALAIMLTSGMYNASGQFAMNVGIPAKSGVSGGILAVVPGQMGIGVIGPAIDDKGNSTAGFQLLKLLSERYQWSMF